MAAPKFPDLCSTCYFENREPAICEGCIKGGSNYEPVNPDEGAMDELRGITFYDDWKDA